MQSFFYDLYKSIINNEHEGITNEVTVELKAFDESYVELIDSLITISTEPEEFIIKATITKEDISNEIIFSNLILSYSFEKDITCTKSGGYL